MPKIPSRYPSDRLDSADFVIYSLSAQTNAPAHRTNPLPIFASDQAMLDQYRQALHSRLNASNNLTAFDCEHEQVVIFISWANLNSNRISSLNCDDLRSLVDTFKKQLEQSNFHHVVLMRDHWSNSLQQFMNWHAHQQTHAGKRKPDEAAPLDHPTARLMSTQSRRNARRLNIDLERLRSQPNPEKFEKLTHHPTIFSLKEPQPPTSIPTQGCLPVKDYPPKKSLIDPDSLNKEVLKAFDFNNLDKKLGGCSNAQAIPTMVETDLFADWNQPPGFLEKGLPDELQASALLFEALNTDSHSASDTVADKPIEFNSNTGINDFLADEDRHSNAAQSSSRSIGPAQSLPQARPLASSTNPAGTAQDNNKQLLNKFSLTLQKAGVTSSLLGRRSQPEPLRRATTFINWATDQKLDLQDEKLDLYQVLADYTSASVSNYGAIAYLFRFVEWIPTQEWSRGADSEKIDAWKKEYQVKKPG